jgi:hypothetical protein
VFVTGQLYVHEGSKQAFVMSVQAVPDDYFSGMHCGAQPQLVRVRCGRSSASTAGHPVVEVFVVAAGEHLGERADMAGGLFRVGAGGQHQLEGELLVDVQLVGMARSPGCETAPDRPQRWPGFSDGGEL